MTHAVQSRLETAIEKHFKQLINASNEFTRTTLSATVSKFVEENQGFFLFDKTSPSGAVSQSAIAQQDKTCRSQCI